MEASGLSYDAAIVGGGLGGLSLAIQLAASGHKVVLLEKEKYPFHKVCGEYISMESWPFLEQLGIPLENLDLPRISQLQLTAPNGKTFQTGLPMGGFGMSRYNLDQQLAGIAVQKGVTLLEECKVEDVGFDGRFTVRFVHQGKARQLEARFCCGAYGKRSNLDVKWQRPFTQRPAARMDNYIAVKYHIHTSWPEAVIGLHNFENGYCGISQIEGSRFCLCYLTTAKNLKACNSSIPQMEDRLLGANPVLRGILSSCRREPGFPLTIAQVSFSRKTAAERNVLMLGDAAGMITPLCGNGMSMALHGSKLAAPLVHRFLQDRMELPELIQEYRRQWNLQFGKRMAAGRTLQYFFGKKVWSNLFVGLFRQLPFLAAYTIRQTHGRPF